MKKILFILLFVAITLPAIAADDLRPELFDPNFQPWSVNSVPLKKEKPEKRHFSKKQKEQKNVKNVNNINNVNNEESASEKTIESVKKEQKKKAKQNKNKKQSVNNLDPNAKNMSNFKELNNILNESHEDYTQKAVSHANDKKTLVNTAYSASIDVTKIIEVNQCVKYALENHPAIRYAMGNAEVYKSRIAQAWANYFPTLSAGISYSRNDAQYTTAIAHPQRYDMYYMPNVSGSMLLFDFGKTKAVADIAKRSYESAKFGLQNTINDVIFNVKQSYYNLLFAQQQVMVYEDTVKDYTMHLEQAKAYYRIGTKAKIDVLTAEQNLGTANLNLIQAKNTLKIAFAQLSNAMGMPDYNDFEVTDNLKMKAYDITADEALKTALETSPELSASKKKADASELLVRSSIRAFTPDITGFAGYTQGGKRTNFDNGYQFGAQLTYSGVNLLQLKKQVDEAKAAYKRDLAEYENVKQNINLEVKEAYYNLVNAQESIVAAKLTMDTAKEQYDLASGRYKVGLGDAVELKDAETTYRNAQLKYYNTLLSYHVSAANLERVMGSPITGTDTDLL